MEYYKCFSWKQKECLKKYGLKYEFKAKHIETNKVFYFYFWSYELDRCLKEYGRLKDVELHHK